MANIELVERGDGTATLLLQGGRANALSYAFCTELLAALEQARVDSAIRGLIVTGCDGFFSAGRDLREADEGGVARRPGNSFESALRAAFSFPKPMIAAVNGHAIAGGLFLALAADHCVLADGTYKLGLTELDIGLPLPRVAFEIQRFALSSQALARLAYGADLVGPAEAYQIGVGQELVPAADLERSAHAWLSPIAARPLAPFALCKSWLRSEALARIDAQSAAERQAINDAASTDETRVRLAAYAKRLRH
jgi:enoyl-CoA hydratase